MNKTFSLSGVLRFSQLLLLVVVSSLLLPAQGFADWKGTIDVDGIGSTAVPGKEQPALPGRIFAKGGKLRFEVNAQGRDMIIVTDMKSQKSSMLMPQQKMFMEMPASMMGGKQPVNCSTEDIDGCLTKKGYKKTGSETIDGHPCAIYEGDEKFGDQSTHSKIWRPTDLKEVFMVKSVAKSGKTEITTHVKNIQLGALDNSLFTIPSDYKKMQIPDFGSTQHH